jgi:hypothetical protein
MEDQKRQKLTCPKVRVTYLPTTDDAFQHEFFHLFDLLGLEEELMPPDLRKRFRGIICKPKVVHED